MTLGPMTSDVEHGFLLANGVRLHYVQSGQGKLVLFLHGFPQCWYAWRKVLPGVGRFRRAVALDLRGYNDSDKPIRVGDYRLESLVEDVARAIRALGAYRADVVGHDWGGVIAWELASRRPELVDRLVVINGPHPEVMRRRLLTDVSQLARSWYILLFQLPGLPELFLGRDRCAFLEKAFRPFGSDPRIGPEAIAFYRKALSRPGALQAALNYYRAALRSRLFSAPSYAPVSCPTLMLWGEKDEALGRELAEDTRRWARDLELRFLDASHWVPEECPEELERSLLDFLGARPEAAACLS